MMYKRLATLLTVMLFSIGANAGVIFQDNFDSEFATGTSKLNYTGFSNWTVENGTVDLIASGEHGLTCADENGKCLDLDGSSRNAGTLKSKELTLAPGIYTLSFDISGNRQTTNGVDSMIVTLSGLLTESFQLSSLDPWQTIVRNISVTTTTTDFLTFNHDGGDNIGILLDNVSLVPEPSTLALFGIALTSLIAFRGKKA